ncbi:Ger(x)C family spore germination protein [Paenibacillus kobensis]|uniref:Ger(x)C family spore germination protein n=1 Tax=Paenibacillus kobensis TaxID=59841 RepID=UPI000FD84747|nr:Ger(x)C family spore germination protein [Paenibacillus kobensis]
MISPLLHKVPKLVVVLSAALFLSGCWDKVDLQNIGYVTAMGVDYEEGQFKLYGEMISFNSVAKTETGSAMPGPKKWIGHSEGQTIQIALMELVKSSQYQLSIENLKTLVIHERAMRELDEVLDAMNRQRAARYTIWVYGTRTPFDQLFTTDQIFNQSPLVSFLYKPDLMFRQVSMYRPLNMQMFIQQQYERAYTTILTNITMVKGDWKTGRKPLSLNVPQGSFIMNNRRLIGYITESEMKGLRWVLPDFKQEMLRIEADGHRATVAVDQSVSRLSGMPQGDSARFKLKVKLRVHVVEMKGELTKQQVEAEASRQVHEEIKRTYEAGVEKHADLLQTRLNLYRYHTAFWKKYASKDDWMPGKGDMTIEVTTKMTNTGKYDLE